MNLRLLNLKGVENLCGRKFLGACDAAGVVTDDQTAGKLPLPNSYLLLSAVQQGELSIPH